MPLPQFTKAFTISVMSNVTVKELAKRLKVPVHRIYYALKVGAIAATFDEQLGRYFFDDNAAKNAASILCPKKNRWPVPRR